MHTGKERFKVLTKYIGKISAAASLGRWEDGGRGGGTSGRIGRFTLESFSGLMTGFKRDFRRYSAAHPEYGLTRYSEILAENGLDQYDGGACPKNLKRLGPQAVLALIMRAIRAERLCKGALPGFLKDGSLVRYLKRLKDIDWQRKERVVTDVEFEVGGYFGGWTAHHLTFKAAGAEYSQTGRVRDPEPLRKAVFPPREADALRKRIAAIHTEYWNADYFNDDVLDGEQWNLRVRYADGYTAEHYGSNAYPEKWNTLLAFFRYLSQRNDYRGVLPERQPGRLIYCSVSLGEGGKTYYYTTEDESINIGDEVIVPVGENDNELRGTVRDIGYFLPGDAPYPPARTKAVIRKADRPDTDAAGRENGVDSPGA